MSLKEKIYQLIKRGNLVDSIQVTHEFGVNYETLSAIRDLQNEGKIERIDTGMIGQHYFKVKSEARKSLRHIFKIDDGEGHWYSAESEAAALLSYATDNGYKTAEEMETYLVAPEIGQLDDNQNLTVNFENNNQTKTCRQWADEMNGLISTTII